MDTNILSHQIIECVIEAHRTLGGPGLLASVYEEAHAWELAHQQLHVGRQVCLPMQYKSMQLATPLRGDLLVKHVVIVECKSVEVYNPLFEAQARTYRRLSNLRRALVIHFGAAVLKDGIHRVVNGLPQCAYPSNGSTT